VTGGGSLPDGVNGIFVGAQGPRVGAPHPGPTVSGEIRKGGKKGIFQWVGSGFGGDGGAGFLLWVFWARSLGSVGWSKPQKRAKRGAAARPPTPGFRWLGCGHGRNPGAVWGLPGGYGGQPGPAPENPWGRVGGGNKRGGLRPDRGGPRPQGGGRAFLGGGGGGGQATMGDRNTEGGEGGGGQPRGKGGTGPAVIFCGGCGRGEVFGLGGGAKRVFIPGGAALRPPTEEKQ